MQLLITCLMAHRKQLACKARANTITGDWIGYQKLVNLFALDQGIAIGYKSSGIQSNSVLQRNLDDAFLARWQFMLFSSLLARCCLSLCTWAAGQFRISSSAYKFNLQLLIHRTHQVFVQIWIRSIFLGAAYISEWISLFLIRMYGNWMTWQQWSTANALWLFIIPKTCQRKIVKAVEHRAAGKNPYQIIL